MAEKIVYTLEAKCKDCYRCIRVCPVKAISFSGSQANVDNEKCIVCGTCIRECPQGAKTFKSDIANVEMLLEKSKQEGYKVAASVAPAFVSAFEQEEIEKIPAALKELGFHYAAETAIGAYETAIATAEKSKTKKRSEICTACPAAVNYITMYRKENIDNLVTVVSPMIAHAKKIKKDFGEDIKIVFIGPCIAKKSEIKWDSVKGLVDYAITFLEFKELLNRSGIDLSKLQTKKFDEEVPGKSRFFPLPGGLLKTASLENDGLDKRIYHTNGFDELKSVVDNIDFSDDALIEPLFCKSGCINGPGMINDKNIFEKRKDIINYASKTQSSGVCPEIDMQNLEISFKADDKIEKKAYSEEEIQKVLQKTAKFSKEDELNCGACGYDSCRDKAIAVLEGMAEPEMCIPYMRKVAESKASKIFETSPNGLLIADSEFKIISMNDAFKKMFLTSDAILGKHISTLFDPQDFYDIENEVDLTKTKIVNYDSYGIKCRQIIYYVQEDRQYIGIFINITKTDRDKEKLDEMKRRTLLKAKELLEHQIDTAQKMAVFLGESTAKGEELVNELLSISEDDE